MEKILLIPLDERPCNYDFGRMITSETKYKVVAPPKSIMGFKKEPAQMDNIASWLKDEIIDATGVVIAFDMLLYGGIVPSRLHHDSVETIKNRLNLVREIKSNNPNVIIYGFQLLMRNPAYSSSEEEPDYYEDFGREIHLYGVYTHKLDLGIITEEEKKHFEAIKNKLPNEFLLDYTKRRDINSELNNEFLNLVKDGTLEFGIIPQDDSSPYGFTALDQIKIRSEIEKNNLELNVYMYPGADEVANVLISKMILSIENKRPKIYLKYSTISNGQLIPLYEDRYLGETLKYQILASGCILVDDLSMADIVLLVNSPSKDMMEASNLRKKKIEYDVQRTLVEFIEFADFCIKELKKPVIIADVAYANGGDTHLLKLIKQKGLLTKLSGYAGWNTSSNTIGTAIPQGILDYLYPNRKAHLNFLGLRYVEDIGYCTIVRQQIAKTLEPPNHYFLLDGQEGKVVNNIKGLLDKFIEENLSEKGFKPLITHIYSPWNRMFEIGLEVEVDEN